MESSHAQSTPRDFPRQSDVGSVSHPGSCTAAGPDGPFVLSGAGRNIWGDHDDFHFVWRRMRGDFIVTARARFRGEGANPHRKLGWMARTALGADSPHASAVVHGDGLLALQYRRARGAQTQEVTAPSTGAEVVQLERRGSTWIMSVAEFGAPFVAVEVDELELGDDVHLGLFVCSHEHEVTESAEFRDVRLVVPAAPGFDRARDPFASRLETLDAETGDRRVLESVDDVIEAPNWTRDGAALVYNSHGLLYRYDLAMGTAVQINTGRVVHNNNDHVLSFDGSMLGISSHAEGDGSIVYTLPSGGGEPTRVTPAGPSYLHGWSPDGSHVVYTGQRDGAFDIYRMPVPGGKELRLTNTPGLDDGPEYTPDGEYIYFNSVRSGRMQIWRMRPDGSGQEQLTDDECDNWFPHVSPDGTRVAFVSYLPGEVDPSDHPAARRVYIRIIPRDGGEPKVLAYLYGGQGTMNVPSWSPDGRHLAFVSNTVPYS